MSRLSFYSTRLFVGIFLTFFVLFGCATPTQKSGMSRDSYKGTRNAITSLIQDEMKRHNIQGMSIALVDDQRIVWAEGFGYADRDKRIAAMPETIYPAGSIAKLFTITAALQLADEKRIDLDQPLRTYLPDFSMKTRFVDSGPITPRTIMTHHSGLPSDHLREMISRDPTSLAETERELRDEWVAYPPNFIFSYSNVALRLLGLVIERISYKDFDSHLRDTLFLPLNMVNTSFVPEPHMSPLLSKGYRGGWEAEEILLRPLPSPEGPAYSSVIDLGRFIRMIFAGGKVGDLQILRPETLSEAIQPQNTDISLDLDFRIGLGWFLNDPDIRNGGLVVSHGGTLSLFHSQLTLLPEHKLGVVVLSNSSGAVHVVSRIAEETLKIALEEKTGIKQPALERMGKEPVIPWPETLLKDYAGHYATGLRVFTVRAKNGKLHTRLMGRKVQLVLHPSGRFSLRYRLFGLIPVKLGQFEQVKFSVDSIQGRKILALHHKGKRHLLGEKIEASPVTEAWLRRVGEYGLVDPGNYLPVIEKAELKYEDQFLMLDVRIPMLGDYGIERLQFAIQPVSDTEAVLLGLGRNMGETIQVVIDHGGERLHYSGLRFEKKPETSSFNHK